MNKEEYKYLVGGIVFKTPVFFPEFVETDLPHDTTVNYGEIPVEALEMKKTKALLSVNENNEFLFEMPNLAKYFVKGTKEVIIELLDEKRKYDAEKYILTFVLGLISYKKGFYPLHGGGIVHNGEAYLFTGLSGAGKSTTMAALQAKGFEMLGDDIANLFIKDGRVYMHPCFPRFKLWEESLQLLDRKNQGEYRLKTDMNKYLVPVDNSFKNTPIPVKRIYHLNEEKDLDAPVRFELLKGHAKLNKLKANSYKPWAVKTFKLNQVHFKLMSAMLPNFEWFDFYRPKNKDRFHQIIDELIVHIKK